MGRTEANKRVNNSSELSLSCAHHAQELVSRPHVISKLETIFREVQSFTITEKDPTIAFSWLKVLTNTYTVTFKKDTLTNRR